LGLGALAVGEKVVVESYRKEGDKKIEHADLTFEVREK
jgi:hypothetical protein